MNNKSLKQYGRYGDTQIRNVNGEKSHVNSIEAALIDRYGKRGEDLVQKIGAGTINPKTGLKEHFWDLAAIFAGPALHWASSQDWWPGGENEYGGFDTWHGAGKEGRWRDMEKQSGETVDAYQEAQRTQVHSPYGMLGDEEFDVDFDPTSVQSIAEGLAKREFMDVVQGELESITGTSQDREGGWGRKGWKHAMQKNIDEGGIWSYATDADDIATTLDGETVPGYAQIGQEDIDDYWDVWLSEQQGTDAYNVFESQAKTAGITQGELNMLSPGASEWRNMARPLQQEAEEMYRIGVGQIGAQTGGLRTGSAARRRQDLRSIYGEGMTDIKGKISGERKKRMDVMAGRIRKLMG